ncbi:UvrD-helicase domain-containing protein [Sphingobium sp.]|uniref:UvrD-helicase domain-containing protein n=1 Tax=Sphingobium sp. TaxID=1912891 RepID=UPI0035C75A57
MIGDNTIIIAAAGAGKTTYLVEQAMKVPNERVLITTYTECNEAEIRQKFFDLVGRVPAHVTIMTWFSFLITHGVKPFQGCIFDFEVAGMMFAVTQSGIKTVVNGHPVPYAESEFRKHFFDRTGRVFSDKLPKLVIRCNEKSGGAVVDRLTRLFPHVFVDEVQDLAGYDLDILAALARSRARLLMVGDPRQVTYLTHHEKRYKKYSDGGIVKFVETELRKVPFTIDDATLGRSHRNNALICAASSRLYPDLPASAACECEECRASAPRHSGLFLVRASDYAHYVARVRPMQLRDKSTTAGVDSFAPVMNFGESKGRGFDHVVIIPTKPMKAWLKDPASALAAQSRARFYVAMTRGRHSVAIATDWGDDLLPDGFEIYRRPTVD